jgi:hypothetical protein
MEEDRQKEPTWWSKHKKKVYIGTAIAAIAIIPFGTLMLPGLYLKIKGPKPEDKPEEEKKEIEDEKKKP